MTTYPNLTIIDDQQRILFDLHDPTGTRNPLGMKTLLAGDGGFQMSSAEHQPRAFESLSGDGGVKVGARHGLTTRAVRVRTERAASYEALRAAVEELGRLIEAGGVLRWRPTAETEPRFIDYLYGQAPGLYRGQDRDLFRAISLLRDPDGLPIEFTTQPFARGPRLADRNFLANPTLLVDGNLDGRPDSWGWDATTGIIAERISHQREAFSVTLAGDTTRLLRQTIVPPFIVPGGPNYWDAYVFFNAGDAFTNSGWRMRLRLVNLDGSNNVISTHQTPEVIWDPSTGLSFTTNPSVAFDGGLLPGQPEMYRLGMRATLSGNTASVRFEVELQTLAGSAIFLVKLAQMTDRLEPDIAVTDPYRFGPWRAGRQVVRSDPAAESGRVFPVYVEGSAPTPAELVVTPSAGVGHVTVARRSRQGRVGDNLLSEYLNHLKIRQAEAATLGTDASLVADASASPGSGNSAVDISFATNNLSVNRLTWEIAGNTSDSQSLLMNALRGEWEVWARVFIVGAAAAETNTFDLQLAWALGQGSTPQNFQTRRWTSTIAAAWHEVRIGRLFVPREQAAAALTLRLRAMRIAGARTLRVDHLTLIPAERVASLDDPAPALSVARRPFLNEEGIAYVLKEAVVGAPGPENQAIASATARGAVPLVLEPGLNVLYLHFGRTLGADSSWQTDRSENPTVELVYAPRYRGL